MNVWKHKAWETTKGVWLIASDKMTDEQIKSLILCEADKYGYLHDWQKIR